jgi:hypothetical protein
MRIGLREIFDRTEINSCTVSTRMILMCPPVQGDVRDREHRLVPVLATTDGARLVHNWCTRCGIARSGIAMDRFGARVISF